MRAFDLGLVINNIPGRISSVVSWENKVFVGTTDGHLILYTIEEEEKTSSFQSRLEKKKSLKRGKKSIDQVAVLGSTRDNSARIVVLCDGHLDVLHPESLEVISSISAKSVSTFCLEKGSTSPGPPRLCVATKKKLLLHSLENGAFKLYKEVPIPDPAVTIEWYGGANGRICVGHKKQYSLVTLPQGTIKSLVEIDSKTSPLIKSIKDQFLVGVDMSLGLLLTSDGLSTPTKIRWTHSPLGASYRFPYLISVQKEGNVIEIHNISNGICMQNMGNLPQAITVLNDAGPYILAASATKVHCLLPIPFERQVKELLKEIRVKEATDLFTAVLSPSDPDYKSKLRQFHQEAGIIYFINLKFKDAFEEFREGEIDPRELIWFFPNIPPKTSLYRPLNSFNVEEIVRSKLETRAGITSSNLESEWMRYILEAKLRLVDFLDACRKKWVTAPDARRTSAEGRDLTLAIDTAMLKLYGDTKNYRSARDLLLLFRSTGSHASSPSYDVDDVVAYLTERRRFAALAEVYKDIQMAEKALVIWERLGNGEYADASLMESEGQNNVLQTSVRETVEILTTEGGGGGGGDVTEETSLVFRFARWVLAKNLDEGIRIFTTPPKNRKTKASTATIDAVLDFLSAYGGETTQRYLEHVVWSEGSTEEKYATRLALLYTEAVLDLIRVSGSGAWKSDLKPGTEPGLLGKKRAKLLVLLEKSTAYNVATVLQQLKDSPLHEEAVLLYDRIGNHRQALGVMVDKMQDYERAERYCLENKKTNDREELLLSLLQVYLGNNSGKEGGVVPEPAMNLLNKYAEVIPPTKVLPLLPSSTLLADVMEYLKKAIQASHHETREAMVVRNLRKLENLLVSSQLSGLQAQSVRITRETLCSVCKKPISDKVFGVYPNGVIVHFNCQPKENRSVCPVTGTDFKAKFRQF